MKLLKLNYYNGELYEKYKINNILSLLVDKHKLQNESLGLSDFGNKQNNYSIIALLGSQIKNINDEEYKNIDTNDIIFALSELKKLDEHIAYNESISKNYISEMAKQLYYEYSEKGLISKDNNFNSYSSKFIQINLELMDEINKEVEHYENKIFSLRAYSEEEKRKRDSLSHRRSNASSASSVLNMNENENNIYFNMMKKHDMRNEKHMQKNAQENIYKAHTKEYLGMNTHDVANKVSEISRGRTKGEMSDHVTTGDSYENYISLKKRNSHLEENEKREKYEGLRKNDVPNHLKYLSKEDVSTHCNSNELLPDVILSEHNTTNGLKQMDHIRKHMMDEEDSYFKKRLSRLSSHDTNMYKDQENWDLLKRKMSHERKKEERSASIHTRKTTNDNRHLYRNRHSDGMLRKNNVYDEQSEKYPINASSPSPYHKNFMEPYEKTNSFIKGADIMSDKRDEGFKRAPDLPTADNMSTYTSIYGTHPNSKNNTTSFFNNVNSAPNTTLNPVLENIDKAERQLVTNHLKNSMTHNETVARRMSSILLNPAVHQKETFAKTPCDIHHNNMANENHMNSDGSVRKYSNSIKHYNNSNASINKYSSASDQLNHYNADSNNDSSVILSSVNNRGTTVAEDSYKRMAEVDSINYMNRGRYNYTKDLNYNYPSKFMNLETNDNGTNHKGNAYENNDANTTPFTAENISNLSKKYSKPMKYIPNTYTTKYTRALDINDLNSNTSKNYVNSTNSLKSDFTVRDTYSRMYERSKSLTSQINKPPLSYKYLKANI